MRHGAISECAGGLDLRFVARDCHNLLTRYRCLGVAGLVDGSVSDVVVALLRDTRLKEV